MADSEGAGAEEAPAPFLGKNEMAVTWWMSPELYRRIHNAAEQDKVSRHALIAQLLEWGLVVRQQRKSEER